MEVLSIADAKKGAKPTGVCHGSELALVFRDQELLLGRGEGKLADQVGSTRVVPR